MALEACNARNIPFIIYPHGSPIEYTVKKDPRYLVEARKAIIGCHGLIIGNHEVRDRICSLFPDLKKLIFEKTEIVGVGVDTCLFTPRARALCSETIAAFLDTDSTQNPQGKSPELVKALHHELEQNNYTAITATSDHYVQNDVDTNIKEKLGSIDFSQPVILFVGALTVGKGLQSLICALPIIYKTYPFAQLIIIGAGSFREELEAFIASVLPIPGDAIY